MENLDANLTCLKYENFQTAYKDLLQKLKTYGQDVSSRGFNCKELRNLQFTITKPQFRLLDIPFRNQQMRRYIFGELLWYLSASDDVNFIKRYSKFWEKISDDGMHSNSAYGKYIFRPFTPRGEGVFYPSFYFDNEKTISQWDWVKSLLIKDNGTREAVIHIKPIQMYETKDVVCTIALIFQIRNGKLNLTTIMRSNDIIKGLTYDVFMFTFLQELMAVELDVPLGEYTHFTTSLHLYEQDNELADKILNEMTSRNIRLCDIQKDFRERDLPLLLAYEKDGFAGIGLDKMAETSQLTYQLINFLEDSNYVREKI